MTIREHHKKVRSVRRKSEVLKGDVSLRGAKKAEPNGTNGELRSHETRG